MNRDVYRLLDAWRGIPDRKPLLLRGARQVGKSWLIKELGKTFPTFVEVNFEETPEMCGFFQESLEPDKLVLNIANYLGRRIEPGKTLLFLDEIQACPRAITALRYFYEKLPGLHVAAAGSLIEFELQQMSVPVGRVEFLYVYPLSFSEFLDAIGRNDLREYVANAGLTPVPDPIHNQILRHVRDYVLIGGMPRVVAAYAERQDIHECQRTQTTLLETFRADFAKYAGRKKVEHLRTVFDAIPLQFGRKFKFSNVSREIRSTELGQALDLLEMAGVIHKVHHSSANGVPLGAEVDPSKFKVLFFDCGLSQRLLGLDLKPILLNSDISLVNHGAIAELFVGLELIAHSTPHERTRINYWHREARASNAEIDYVIARSGKIVPIDVKSGTEGHMRSLRLFMEEKSSTSGYRISKYNHSELRNIRTVPFYGIEAWLKRLDSGLG